MSTRRRFLKTISGVCAASLAAKPGDEFRGVFPIMQTPYLDSGEVDFGTLAKETVFLDKAGVHGMVWPQLASEYARLSFEERIEGAETIVRAARGLRPKVVIGVQAGDTGTAVKFAKHADELGPDAIIALPPRKGDQREFDLDAIKAYYAEVGAATRLPMFIQAIGNMSVEFIVDLMEDVPNLRFVKDEGSGRSVDRIEAFAATKGGPAAFTGSHGRMLIDEMARGVSGNMPAASWVDLYVSAWELWEAGRRGEALDMFSKVLLFVTQTQTYGLAMLNYVLHLRGVFPNWKVRNPAQKPLSAEDRKAIERNYEFVKPYLRA